ncbi:MAG: hypothetical protein CML69_08445 [Rhodobacteraceae bacterium]|nr:hypothetical protein [Paracoccaceae bacterium]
MPLSPRLELPYLEPAQAQKHVTHNEALRSLDMLVQLSVEAFDETTPPALPVTGQVFALGAAPTGDWAGQAGMLALREESGWHFLAPQPGWSATLAGSTDLRIWTGSAWVGASGQTQNLTGLGVNTTSDPTNRLAVAAPASLLTHEGSDHRLTINKASDTDTASLLFQSGWTGHAEMGLAGDTGFSVKVSPDGSSWTSALEVDPTTGSVSAQTGLEVAGHTALHLGNLLGSVSQTGGQPTGAVIESGSNANGSYIRLADGTQICLVQDFDAGSATFAGAGQFTDLYRTDTFSVTWPSAFSQVPHCTSHVRMSDNVVNPKSRALMLTPAIAPLNTGWSYLTVQRLSSDAHSGSVLVNILAIGRWF